VNPIGKESTRAKTFVCFSLFLADAELGNLSGWTGFNFLAKGFNPGTISCRIGLTPLLPFLSLWIGFNRP